MQLLEIKMIIKIFIPLAIMAIPPAAQAVGLEPSVYDFVQTGLVGIFAGFVIYSRKIDNDNLQKMREHYEKLIQDISHSHEDMLARYDRSSQDLMMLVREIKEERLLLTTLIHKTANSMETIASVLDKAWN